MEARKQESKTRLNLGQSIYFDQYYLIHSGSKKARKQESSKKVKEQENKRARQQESKRAKKVSKEARKQ